MDARDYAAISRRPPDKHLDTTSSQWNLKSSLYQITVVLRG